MSTVEAPQHVRAMDHAYQIRSENARLKKRIAGMPRREALLEAARIVRGPVGSERSLRLEHLVMAVPAMGPKKLQGVIVRQMRVKPFMKLKDIPEAQREELARRLAMEVRDQRTGRLR